jgi:hypothetical protein
MKAQWDESGEIILLGDNRGDWAVMLRLIGFQCAGLACTHTRPCEYSTLMRKIRLAPDPQERDHCTGLGACIPWLLRSRTSYTFFSRHFPRHSTAVHSQHLFLQRRYPCSSATQNCNLHTFPCLEKYGTESKICISAVFALPKGGIWEATVILIIL